tara:strand:+ start:1665 stop:3098 length:1434 start_codon:yes stop_codon:yes gene_type:complete
MAGRNLVMNKLEEIYESLIEQKKIKREDVDYNSIIESGSLINKLFMQCYQIFKSGKSTEEKINDIQKLKDNDNKQIFVNRDIAEWFVNQFNDKTVNFMDNLFNKAYRDLKKTYSKKKTVPVNSSKSDSDNQHVGGAPSKSDLSHMNVENNPPGAFGEAFNRQLDKILGSSGPEYNKSSQAAEVLDNAKMTLDSTGKLFGINEFLEADNSDTFFRMAETAGSAIGMVPNLFMKMKNIAEMFIFIPHTLESVLCPYGEVFCTMPFDMISWIITHMNIAAKPFLEATPFTTDMMLASIPTAAPFLLAPPFTPLGMAAMSVSSGTGSIPAVLAKKTFDFLIQHSGDLSLFFLALSRKQYAPALTFAMQAFPSLGSILESQQMGLSHAITWMWRLSSISRYIADGVRVLDIMTRVSDPTEPGKMIKDLWGNRNCIYQLPMFKEYFADYCSQIDEETGDSVCGKCGGISPQAITRGDLDLDDE